MTKHSTQTFVVLFEGNHGSSKGTQSQMLVERLRARGTSARCISASDLLGKSKDPAVQMAMRNRDGVDSAFVVRVLRDALCSALADGVEAIVLEGFPRRFPGGGWEQFDALNRMLIEFGLSLVVVRLRASFEYCDARIQKGRVDAVIAAGGKPRNDDAVVHIRHAALRHYEQQEAEIVRRHIAAGHIIHTVTLADIDETRDSVAARIDEQLENGNKIAVPERVMRLWEGTPGSQPSEQVRRTFRPSVART